jgi:hypothetical protein
MVELGNFDESGMVFRYRLASHLAKDFSYPDHEMRISHPAFKILIRAVGKGACMKRFFILMAIACVSTAAVAQKADFAFTLGGSFVSDQQLPFVAFVPPGGTPSVTSVQTDHHLFLEGTLGFRILNAKVASLHVELPIAGISSQGLTFSTAPSTVVDHLSSTFITPSLRVKILSSAPVSPWFSVGGGWAHYSLDSGGSSSKAALQYGGGLDFKTGLPLLAFRVEVRDFLTPTPDLNSISLVDSGGLKRHNVLAGGGIVLRF